MYSAERPDAELVKPEERFERINLNRIIPDPNQPRQDFDPDKLSELADSITAVGVVQPIRVRLNPKYILGGNDEYMIIAGERRYQASALAGMIDIPAVIVDSMTDDEIYAQQLTENLHREDLNPVERAEFLDARIRQLKDAGSTTPNSDLAAELGVSPSWVSKNLSVLKYDEEIRALAREGHVRDYSLLAKISKLSGAKRSDALDQIKAGTFNSKEFFARKRYEKKSDPGASVKPEKKARSVKFSFDRSLMVKVISATEYLHILNHLDPRWADSSEFGVYVESFQKWLTEREI